MMEELKKEYGLDDEDAKELEDKMKKVGSLETESQFFASIQLFFSGCC